MTVKSGTLRLANAEFGYHNGRGLIA